MDRESERQCVSTAALGSAIGSSGWPDEEVDKLKAERQRQAQEQAALTRAYQEQHVAMAARLEALRLALSVPADDRTVLARAKAFAAFLTTGETAA